MLCLLYALIIMYVLMVAYLEEREIIKLKSEILVATHGSMLVIYIITNEWFGNLCMNITVYSTIKEQVHTSHHLYYLKM